MLLDITAKLCNILYLNTYKIKEHRKIYMQMYISLGWTFKYRLLSFEAIRKLISNKAAGDIEKCSLLDGDRYFLSSCLVI